MKARDVMVSPVVTVKHSATVQDVATTLLERKISAVPVVDQADKVIGMVSEADLLHRVEAGTERRRSWLLRAFSAETVAADFVKARSRKVTDIMTPAVIAVTPDTPLYEIAALLERHRIKRVPVIADGKLVGIVSRANLVQAVASAGKQLGTPPSDKAIRDAILAQLKAQPWAHSGLLNVTVTEGVVDLWGFSTSEAERKAIRVAAESAPGVCKVNDNLLTATRLEGY